MPPKTRGQKKKTQTVKFANGSLQTVFQVESTEPADSIPPVQPGKYVTYVCSHELTARIIALPDVSAANTPSNPRGLGGFRMNYRLTPVHEGMSSVDTLSLDHD
jgi:hypothetical protein